MPRARGFTHSTKTRQKMSAAQKGTQHWNWQGGTKKLEYDRVHRWIKRIKGKASKCEKCGTEEATQFDWSNKSGLYLYNTTDWQQLCVSCHRKFDGVWNKGKRKERPTMICEWCGANFIQNRAQQLFCSRSCTARRNGNIAKRNKSLC